MCLLYGVAMKEQAKPSRVNTVLLVIILVLNLVLGGITMMATLETNQDIVKIAKHLDSQAEVFAKMNTTFDQLQKAIAQ